MLPDLIDFHFDFSAPNLHTSVLAVDMTHPEYLRGQGSAGRGGVGYDGFTPKREGGVSVDRDRRGGLEGLRDSG